MEIARVRGRLSFETRAGVRVAGWMRRRQSLMQLRNEVVDAKEKRKSVRACHVVIGCRGERSFHAISISSKLNALVPSGGNDGA